MHKLNLHLVLDGFHAHILHIDLRDGCGNLRCEDDVLTLLGNAHCLEDGVNDLSVVEHHDSTVAFNYIFYHKLSVLLRSLRKRCGIYVMQCLNSCRVRGIRGRMTKIIQLSVP